MSTRYKVLYTHQKQKKKKTWQDGYLELLLGSKKARLLTEELKELDSLFVKNDEVVSDAELESDRFMITVEYKCGGDVTNGKENKPLNNNSLIAPKPSKVPTFKKPPMKFSLKKSEEHFHSSQKPSQPFHPSLSMPHVIDNSNGSHLIKTSQQRTDHHIANPPYQTKETNEFMGIYSPDTCTESSTNFKTNTVKVKRSTNEILSLFTGDFEDDDTSMFSINVSCNKENDSSSSFMHPCISTRNYISDRCDSVEIEQKSCSSKEAITSSDFLGLFSQREHVTDSYDIASQSANDKFGQSEVNFVNTDEETDMVDEFADDFLDTDGTDIFGHTGDDILVSDLNEFVDNDDCDGNISGGHDEDSTSVHQNQKRILTKDIYNTASKKRCVNYGNRGNSNNVPLQDIPAKKVMRHVFSVPTSHHRNIEYKFASKEETFQKTLPKRSINIPKTFESVTSYKLIFKSVINEHINILLFGLAGKYHNALERADVTAIQYGGTSGSVSTNKVPACSHGPSKMNAVRKEGKNKGRLFYACPNMGPGQCKFFLWADELKNKAGKKSTKSSADSNKVTLSDYHSASLYFNSHGIQFYFNVKFLRKVPYKNFWKSKKSGLDPSMKKSMYISLPIKKASSFYGKEDLWVVSKSMDFSPGSTFIAKSVFYGPKANGELEISPLCSYSSPNWQNEEICYAIQAFNAVTELTCIDNIDNFVNTLDVPVLPSLLSCSAASSQFNITSTRFNLSSLPPNEILGLVQNTAASFSLNEDQSCALEKIAHMFVSGNSENVTLIHGVFGAGKSYLLSVVVLFLVHLFEIIETRFQLDVKLKILISSITNVAVDRVLQMLVDHGFDEFIRVGSVKKIAKQILPYSVHTSDKDDQELKELNELLASELTDQERGYVKKAIELHKLGVNRNKLAVVRVVGVTCAACVFPFLQQNVFQVQLQDECSQMMEPVSMLPIARFKCQRLILVGDPKQLSPTIQGSEAEHSFSLEMTLFERLQQLGYQPCMLRTQYRCHPSISAICNEMFYEGVLKDGISCDQREPIIGWLPTLSVIDVDDGQEEFGNDGSYLNLKEANIIVNLLDKILKCGIDPHQVGVITQYKSQVWKINSLLRSSSDSTLIKSIQISTVDAFQGAEKDIILLSCVRTRHIGFIDCHRRTNVALSRAKKHLVIVGKLKLLNSNACWSGVLSVCKVQNATVSKSNVFMKSLESVSNDI